MSPDLSRYARQTIFPGIGQEGQKKLLAARVVVVGCGATGTVIANHLVRAGAGHVTIIDRDFIELNNLQRQLLFDEDDLAQNLPKAVAAERKLRAINRQIEVKGIVADLNPENIAGLLAEADLVMDGTDNFEARYLINDFCVQAQLPWIYTGVVGSYGMSQTIIPGQTACLRCLMPALPPPGTMATCDTAGVIGPAVGAVASFSAAEALKLLTQNGEINRGMLHLDLWTLALEKISLGGPRPDCLTCGRHDYEFLAAQAGSVSTSLCGRNAVQVRPANRQTFQLDPIAANIAAVAEITAHNEFLLRFRPEPDYEITLFADARAIIKGTDDETLARSLYARYVGA